MLCQGSASARQDMERGIRHAGTGSGSGRERERDVICRGICRGRRNTTPGGGRSRGSSRRQFALPEFSGVQNSLESLELVEDLAKNVATDSHFYLPTASPLPISASALASAACLLLQMGLLFSVKASASEAKEESDQQKKEAGTIISDLRKEFQELAEQIESKLEVIEETQAQILQSQLDGIQEEVAYVNKTKDQIQTMREQLESQLAGGGDYSVQEARKQIQTIQKELLVQSSELEDLADLIQSQRRKIDSIAPPTPSPSSSSSSQAHSQLSNQEKEEETEEKEEEDSFHVSPEAMRGKPPPSLPHIRNQQKKKEQRSSGETNQASTKGGAEKM